MANLDFSADGHEPISFGVLPSGDYEMQVIKSEVKDTNAKDGQYASFDLLIIGDGEGNGRHVFQNITLNNKSQKAEEIGRRQLADLCRAVGKTAIQDTTELHDIPFWAKVGIEKGKDNHPDKNKINQFYPAGQGKAPVAQRSAPAPQAPRPQSAPARAPVAAGASTPPWKRK